MSQSLPNVIEIGRPDGHDQRCIRARAALAAGEVIATFAAAAVVARPSRMTLQISADEHIELSPAWLQLVNHGCEPNAYFDVERSELVTIEPIERGEEIRFFYPSTEWRMTSPFDCRCGSPRCLGRIEGAAHVPARRLGEHRLAPHVIALLAQAHEEDRARPFWLGDALTVGARGVELDGAGLAEVAREHGTPVYVYGAATVRRRLAELRAALRDTGAPFRIHYAMKANRCGSLLDLVRREGDIGIDACSPREVERALAAGFAPGEISVTAGMLSNRDLEAFAGHGVHVNLDTTSALRRWAALDGAGRGVGLRVDPGVHVGWSEGSGLSYSHGKFGFEPGAAREAAAFAASRGLEVDTLHMHLGWGLQARDAPQVDVALARIAALAAEIPTVRTLNVGGGLCARQRAADEPLSIRAWSSLLRARLTPTGCTIACEPGTFVAASAGVLVAEVTTVERRRGELWVGLDAGSNVNVYMAHYGIPLAIVPVERPLSPLSETAHVAGNINEANDVFARAVRVPRFEEGDLVALYPAGAYGASMASDHCLRGLPAEVLV